MTTLTVQVPDGKAPDVSSFVKEMGGEVITLKKAKATAETDKDDEITHETFFGENIRRAIKAFKS